MHLPCPLTALIGISGSGKTTFAARYPRTWRVSLDTYRALCADTAADQSATTPAVEIQRVIIDARFARSRPVLVDDTNLDRSARTALLARARYWGRPAAAVLLDTPLRVAVARAARRDRPVPEHVIAAQHAQLPTVDDLLAEGWTAVHRAADLQLIGAR